MYKIAALYKFARVNDPAATQAHIKAEGLRLGVEGTIIIAREGLNGTICASPPAMDEMLSFLRALDGFADLSVKFSSNTDSVFGKLKVRLKSEIVTMGVDGVDPTEQVGTYVNPEDWNALIEDPNTVVIDTRNDYETKIGSFKGALCPDITSFRAFPDWWEAHASEFQGKKVAMFCTGGIRCEKSTSFVKAQGIDDVFHLNGGILKYLEIIPRSESTWDGECFVFDDRVAVTHGLELGEAKMCYGCRRPLMPEDLKSSDYEPGVSCPQCTHETSAEDKQRFRDRQRQRAAG